MSRHVMRQELIASAVTNIEMDGSDPRDILSSIGRDRRHATDFELSDYSD